MMDELLIGYLLDALDEPARREVENYLARNPEARERLVQLEEALAPLAADRDVPAPPPDLVERTLARVAEHACAPKAPAARLPQAPPVSRGAVATGRSWWRRADVLVAASLLVTVAGIGVMVLAGLKAPSSAAIAVECKNNLKEFFFALQHYHESHRAFPDVAKESPRDVAGMVVPILADAGVLSDSASIRCPGIGSPLMCQFTIASLRAMSDDEFALHSPSLSLCYAYSLGHRDPAGAYHAPGAAPRQVSWSQMPIMADRPPAEGILSNSINHGTGQNVLFADGHVRFLVNRTLGAAEAGDDIFVNRDGRVGAGLDSNDVVLGYSSARP